MYIVTSIICAIGSNGIEIENEERLKQTTSVVKLIFTPINALMLLTVLGNTFGKVKDEVLDEGKANKRLLITIIAFIIILCFETNYIKDFILGVLQV